MFRVLLFLMLLADLRWWWVNDRRVRGSAWKRGLLAAFMLTVAGPLVGMMVATFSARHGSSVLAQALLGATFIWHLFVLPAALLGELVGKAAKRVGPEIDPGRRAFLAGVARAAPPVVTLAATGVSIPGLQAFRVRELDVPVAGLAPDLDGATIAHVSDTHMGRFSTPRQMRAVADAVNRMRADLVMFTGDLIDISLKDFEAGAEFLKAIDPRSGMFCVEGNHDLIERPEEFRSRVAGAGLPYLINRVEAVRLRGVDLAVVGMQWWHGGERTDEILMRLMAGVPHGVMPILLAHHPHVWDVARRMGVPLMLAGHTHGGQLNLGRGVGFGPLMYRYWSGLYREVGSSLVVSNGVGNWFPLRVQAPAEVVKIRLRQA